MQPQFCLLTVTCAIGLSVSIAAAQDAPSQSNAAVRSGESPGAALSDSPVVFPAKGALPAKYHADAKTTSYPTEKGYYLTSSPPRSLEQINKIMAEMPKGEFTPPSVDWTYLSRTRKVLNEGGDLHIFGLGDSIVNDTFRSGWIAKLSEAYPKANIRGTLYVRGGGGCRHYRQENRIKKYLVPFKPDLVFIGGISQGKDYEAIRDVIGQIRRELPACEILLAAGTFGPVDPRRPDLLAAAQHSGSSDYGRELEKIAKELKCAYLDMTTPWSEYIRSSGLHPHRFHRDRVHANEFGEQILTKILLAYFCSQWAEIKKLGTIDINLVETTPIVFKGKLYRFEYVRKNYWANKTGESYFRFIDHKTGQASQSFAKGYHLGSAFVDKDTVFVTGVKIWNASGIDMFVSKDLVNWEHRKVFDRPGFGIFNTSICRADDHYVLMYEIGEPAELAGHRFTALFAKSKDMRTWQPLPPECNYSKDRYTAPHCLRYLNGWYYNFFLESNQGYEMRVVRSKDLVHWVKSPLNPVLRFSKEDKMLANPNLSEKQREQIAVAKNINNSDIDFCEYRGKVIINYSWGNQAGKEFLAEAVFEGTSKEFLNKWFPDEK